MCGDLPVRYRDGVSLRRREHFEVPQPNLEAFKKSATYIGPKLLNALPFFDPGLGAAEFERKLFGFGWSSNIIKFIKLY